MQIFGRRRFQLSTYHQLALGFGSVLLVLLGLSATGWWTSTLVAQQVKTFNQLYLPLGKATIDLRDHIGEAKSVLSLHLRSPQADYRKAYRSELLHARDKLNALINSPEVTNWSTITQTIRANIDELEKLGEAPIGAGETQKPRSSNLALGNHPLPPLHQKTSKLFTDIDVDLDSLTTQLTGLAETRGAALQRRLSSFQLVTVTAAIGGTLLAVLIPWLIGRSIASRVKLTKDAMYEIAEGDGNLSRRLTERGADDFTHLSRAFNLFVHKIGGVVDLVCTSSTALSRDAERMQHSSEDTQHQVTRQQNQIREVTTAVDGLARASDEIAASAASAASAARQALDAAENGGGGVGNTVTSINDLAADVQSLAGLVERVASESQNIESVLSIIHTIAEQTNLLALNAAIEAARAGETGRGFAVVADEVRSLSMRTHQETAAIGAIIKQLQTETQGAVEAMVQSRAKAEASVQSAERAGDALFTIRDAVQTITELNEQIATLSETQSTTTTTVNSNIVSISAIADDAAAAAVESNKSSLEISLMAGQLQGLVEQFLQNDSTPQSPAPIPTSTSTSTDTRREHTEPSKGSDDVTLF